jgi:hypothetical protein
MLVTHCSIRPNPISAITRRIRSLFGRSASKCKPAEGWFTLETESATDKRPNARLSSSSTDALRIQQPPLPR